VTAGAPDAGARRIVVAVELLRFPAQRGLRSAGRPAGRSGRQAAVARKVLGLRPLWRLKAALKPNASA
jgi:hypothetical protein